MTHFNSLTDYLTDTHRWTKRDLDQYTDQTYRDTQIDIITLGLDKNDSGKRNMNRGKVKNERGRKMEEVKLQT